MKCQVAVFWQPFIQLQLRCYSEPRYAGPMNKVVRHSEHRYFVPEREENMCPKVLADDLCRSLRSCTIMIPIQVNDPVCANGHDLESLQFDLNARQQDGLIDCAGVYIIGSNLDVLKIGEAGNTGMANRVFRQIDRAWMREATTVCFVQIAPPEFSKLGEQMAFALYFKTYDRLPPHNPVWR